MRKVIAEPVSANNIVPGTVILHDGGLWTVRAVTIGGNRDTLCIRLRGHEPVHVRWDDQVWVQIKDNAKPSIAGFCGLPVSGGAGIKPPLFTTSNDRYFASRLSDFSSQFSDFNINAAELELFVEQEYVKLLAESRPWVKGSVMLYADRRFINPGDDKSKLQLDPGPLTWDERAGVFVAYLSRGRALAQLHLWGEALLDDARQVMKNPKPEDLQRALDDAQRARFTAPPPEHRHIREEMFVLLAAVHHMLGCDAERVFHDAARDFDEETVQRIRQRASDQVTSIAKD